MLRALTTLGGILLAASSLPAQTTIWANNLDGLPTGDPGDFIFSYSYAEAGGNPAVTTLIEAGAGVGGSQAAMMTADFSGNTGSNWMGAGMGHTEILEASVFTSTNLSDYVVGLDYAGAGMGTGSFRIQASFNFSNGSTLEFYQDVTPTTDFQSFSMDLASMTPAGDNDTTLAESGDFLTGFNWLVIMPDLGWGFDNDNVAYMDNLSLTVPEPSTYAAIAGLAVLGLALWRRRR